ncbi:tryptophan halogenase family protein [Parvularcula maris]|uniref:Tryptophan 7-halogenase n=1 Tax=Parvularcula maris TaxID=2965077 RepID=A0A9X2L841_9PROT|nr:tryptophan halogenase family protein [Parvularcula maris]MCQ8184723.1 tryptophan 7-halogenase [Parvularcula maris]
MNTESTLPNTEEAQGAIRRVVVVGGGTAGWLTASILAADHCASQANGLQVTVVESPRIGILGVGEGTWPSLRDTLRRIGISERTFLKRCNASFKQGSRFDSWVSGEEGDSYYHPFEAPPNEDEVDVLSLWRTVGTGVAFHEVASHQAALCQANRAPKQASTPEYAAVANYGYHLDAPAFAELLKQHATSVLGVRHIPADIEDVVTSQGGMVQAVLTTDGQRIEGDFFADCSGSRALLIGRTEGAGVTDVSDVLFNDRALAVHLPFQEEREAVASQTTATALGAGWVWDIALQTRRGIGHVFSSQHSSEEEARHALSDYLQRVSPGTSLSGEEARLIKFRSAYREKPWSGNVAAIGMAAGFVEPLEASAIVMIELMASMLSDTLPENRAALPLAAARFNGRFAYRWERIVDFLKLHYVLSRRSEPYWQAHRDPSTWPERLHELLGQWRFEPPSREDFQQSREIFPAASYAYVLYGMGFETAPPVRRRRKDDPQAIRGTLTNIARTTEQCLAGLPSNRELLDVLTAD